MHSASLRRKKIKYTKLENSLAGPSPLSGSTLLFFSPLYLGTTAKLQRPSGAHTHTYILCPNDNSKITTIQNCLALEKKSVKARSPGTTGSSSVNISSMSSTRFFARSSTRVAGAEEIPSSSFSVKVVYFIKDIFPLDLPLAFPLSIRTHY